MKPSKRRFFTQTDKTLMWDRWQKGESLNSIARLLGTSHSAISGVLSKTGGVRPAERQRSRVALTLAEREEISRGVAAGQSLRTIAAMLGRAPSTISREVKETSARVVATTDCRLAKIHVSRRRELSGVTRDYLSDVVYPGPRRPEKGANTVP